MNDKVLTAVFSKTDNTLLIRVNDALIVVNPQVNNVSDLSSADFLVLINQSVIDKVLSDKQLNQKPIYIDENVYNGLSTPEKYPQLKFYKQNTDFNIYNVHFLVDDRKIKVSAIDEQGKLITDEVFIANETEKGLETKSVPGLVILDDHEKMIFDGAKTAIIRKSPFTTDLGNEFYIVAGNQTRCKVKFEPTKELLPAEFVNYYPQHQITEAQKFRWWPQVDKFYLYTIENIDRLPSTQYVLRDKVNNYILPHLIFIEKDMAESTKSYSDWLNTIIPLYLAQVTDTQLQQIHTSLHKLWENLGQTNRESVYNAHQFVVTELERRKINHAEYSMGNSLDQDLTNKALKSQSIKDAVANLNDFVLISDFLSLVGSSTEKDTAHDIDIVVRAKFIKGTGELQVQLPSLGLKVGRQLPAEFRDLCHFIFEPVGPNWNNYIPLYDLVLRRKNKELSTSKIDDPKFNPLPKGEEEETNKALVNEDITTKRKITPMHPERPPKSQVGYHVNEFFSFEDWYEFQGKKLFADGKTVVFETKYDGIRLQAHRQQDQVGIFTEDTLRNRVDVFPTIADSVEKLPVNSLILDGEMVEWNNGIPIPRHEMMWMVVGKKPPENVGLHYNIFDIIYYDGKQINTLPWSERQQYLDKLFNESHENDGLFRVPSFTATDYASAKTAFTKASEYPGSEGSMVKTTDSLWIPGSRMPTWSKIKMVSEVKMQVIGIRKKMPLETEQAGVKNNPDVWTFDKIKTNSYTYRIAFLDENNKLQAVDSDSKLTPADLKIRWVEKGHIDPATKKVASKSEWRGLEAPKLWLMDKSFPARKVGDYAYGLTYSTNQEAKIGQILTMRPMVIREWKDDTGKLRVSWIFPIVGEIDTERKLPDTITDLRQIIKRSEVKKSLDQKINQLPYELDYELEKSNTEILKIHDIDNYQLPKDDAVLRDDMRIAFAYFSSKKRGQKMKYTLEQIINLATIIVNELVKRGNTEFHVDQMTPLSQELFGIIKDRLAKDKIIIKNATTISQLVDKATTLYAEFFTGIDTLDETWKQETHIARNYPFKYLATKRQIAYWIAKEIPRLTGTDIGKKTFADPFAGSGIMSWVAKSYGYNVHANDLSEYCFNVLKAVIANPDIVLNQDDIDRLLQPTGKHSNIPEYFFDKELRQHMADVWWNAKTKFDGIKQNIALATLGSTAFSICGPFGSPKYLKSVKSFAEMFKYKADSLQQFLINRPAKVTSMDAIKLLPELDVDIVYCDPPYFGSKVLQTTHRVNLGLIDCVVGNTVYTPSIKSQPKFLMKWFDIQNQAPYMRAVFSPKAGKVILSLFSNDRFSERDAIKLIQSSCNFTPRVLRKEWVLSSWLKGKGDVYAKRVKELMLVKDNTTKKAIEPIQEPGQPQTREEQRAETERIMGDPYMVSQQSAAPYKGIAMHHFRGLWSENSREELLKLLEKVNATKDKELLRKVWADYKPFILACDLPVIKFKAQAAADKNENVSQVITDCLNPSVPEIPVDLSKVVNQFNAHVDLRLELPPKSGMTGKVLHGWTLDTFSAGLQYLRNGTLVPLLRNKFLMNKDGDNITAQRKALQPWTWYEIVSPQKPVFEAPEGEVGGTKNTSGRFTFIDYVKVYYGVQKSDYHEYFIFFDNSDLKANSGRWGIQLIKGRPDYTKTPDEFWMMNKPWKTQEPYILATNQTQEELNAKAKREGLKEIVWNAQTVGYLRENKLLGLDKLETNTVLAKIKDFEHNTGKWRG